MGRGTVSRRGKTGFPPRQSLIDKVFVKLSGAGWFVPLTTLWGPLLRPCRLQTSHDRLPLVSSVEGKEAEQEGNFFFDLLFRVPRADLLSNPPLVPRDATLRRRWQAHLLCLRVVLVPTHLLHPPSSLLFF